MLSKKSRLAVQNTRRLRPEKTITTELFTVRVYHGGNVNRFGIVISAKIDKKSVQRHFWRRRIMDAIIHWPNVKKDFVIIAFPRLHTASLEDLRQACRVAGERITELYL